MRQLSFNPRMVLDCLKMTANSCALPDFDPEQIYREIRYEMLDKIIILYYKLH